MNKPCVYLSGPMAGLTVQQANEWRAEVRKNLEPDVLCLSPLRGLDDLQGVIQPKYHPNMKEGFAATNSQMALTRDFLDTKRADIILINLLGAQRVSIGTVLEIAWGFAMHKPLVVAMEPEGNPHDHCLVNESIHVRVYSVEELWRVARSLLLPDSHSMQTDALVNQGVELSPRNYCGTR